LDGNPYGIDFSPIADIPRRQARLVDLDQQQILSTHCDLGSLDMRTIERTPELLTGKLRVAQEAVVYGLVGWFNSQLAGDVELGTGPHQAPTHWRQIYFPFPEPLKVSPERELSISLRPPTEADIPEPSWSWSISDGETSREVDERETFARSPRFVPAE
jgi:protein arginine N-methyltransferase 1/protein arginine N-methyltransferase 3